MLTMLASAVALLLCAVLALFALLLRQRRQQAALQLAAVAFDALDAIVITDARQAILRVNRGFTRITGYSAQEAIGRNTGHLLKSGRHDKAFYAEMWAALQRKGHWHGQIWNRRRNGEVYSEWLSITAVADSAGTVQHYVAMFSDITQKQREDEALRALAFEDALTGLPNRRLLRDRLEQALSAGARHGKSTAVLFIDIDHFKLLNDTLGHSQGDQLLVELAGRLRRCVRESDTVARQGGDEFVVVLADLHPDFEQAARQAEAVAQHIRREAGHPFVLDGQVWHNTLSIGVAIGSAGQPASELMRRADAAMYAAKRGGRNAVQVSRPEAGDAAAAVA